jgi:hypothetical protein
VGQPDRAARVAGAAALAALRLRHPRRRGHRGLLYYAQRGRRLHRPPPLHHAAVRDGRARRHPSASPTSTAWDGGRRSPPPRCWSPPSPTTSTGSPSAA